MTEYEAIPAEIERLAAAVVDAAIKVHRELGPGLLESVYERCLAHELRKRGISVLTQVVVPLVYDGIEIEAGFRVDMLVGGCLIVELKAVDRMEPLFEAQLLTYLKLSRNRLGLLINFNVPLLKQSLKRIIR